MSNDLIRDQAWNEDNRRRRNEIGELPQVVDPERRERCSQSLLDFCNTYFKDLFYLDFSEVHLKLIESIQETILQGSLKAIALPRGSGKTTISQVAIIWALANGHRSFVALIASEATRAQQLLADIRVLIETSELFCEDYPEIVIPLRKLENIAIKAKSQTYNGVLTRIVINANNLVLPTIAGSKSSGSRIFATGLTSSNLRGAGAVTAEGKKIRPDFCLIDDPSTFESAKSSEQNDTRERIIQSDILGMSGAGKKLATLITCTVIAEDDLAMRLLDHAKSPDFNGLRISLMPKFPDNMDMWRQYRQIMLENKAEATQFYSEHRDEMDKGAEVTWESRFNHDEISAIQNAMNLFFHDESSFRTEYQNEPAIAKDEMLRLTSQQIKLCRQDSDDEEPWVRFRTASIDVHKDLLYWTVWGWNESFKAQLLASGSYPEQPRAVFNHSDATRLLNGDNVSLQNAIMQTIDYLRNTYDVNLIGVDIGYQTTIVQEALRSSGKHVYGMRGIYQGARTTRLMSDYKANKNLKLGNHWNLSLKDGNKTLYVDVNFWKTYLYQRIADKDVVINATDGELTQLVNHLRAESALLVQTATTSCYEWSCKKGSDNHLLDTIVYNFALASAGGAVDNELAPAKKVKRSMYKEALK